MLTIFVRSVILYAASLLAMRAMGKRQVGQLQPFEMVVVIMIAELAATPMGGVGIPLLYGILPMLALVVCHGMIAFACMKSQRLRVWLSGQPTVLVRDGIICEKQLRRCAIDLNDLMEAMRTGGVLDPAEVGTVILETGGQISVFPKADYRSVSPVDLQLRVGKEGIPLPLVLDGVVQRDNLTRSGLTEEWLHQRAGEAGITELRSVLIMCLNTRGELLVQGKGCTETKLWQAIPPEGVTW
ncbi:MAG: DUF421 domain-containing protein [Clostridia bacterium]|nr:DUF421 domain-containing protein [Clostridia bacterium]